MRLNLLLVILLASLSVIAQKPTTKKIQQLSEKQRQVMLGYLDSKLLEHTAIGGTLPRRLNQAEYEATIQKLLHLPDFELPQGFPSDTEYRGFNNVGEGLVLSPPHLEAYARVARDIADEIFPPSKSAPEKKTWNAGPDDMVLSFSAAGVHGDALRLASRSVDIMRSCTWPSRIEISDSGTYRISVDASRFLSDNGRPFEEAMILEVYARAVTASERSKISDFRLLKEIKVTSEEPQATAFKADLCISAKYARVLGSETKQNIVFQRIAIPVRNFWSCHVPGVAVTKPQCIGIDLSGIKLD